MFPQLCIVLLHFAMTLAALLSGWTLRFLFHHPLVEAWLFRRAWRLAYNGLIIPFFLVLALVLTLVFFFLVLALPV